MPKLGELSVTRSQYKEVVSLLKLQKPAHACKLIFDLGLHYDKEKPWIKTRFVNLKAAFEITMKLKAKMQPKIERF